MVPAMTSPYAGSSNYVVDPDYNIWVPALRPAEFEGGDLDLEQWAVKIAASSWAKGITPDPDDYERIRRLLMLVGSQDFPSIDSMWMDKWIHYPDRDDMPLPVMISDHDVEDDGSDDELRAYLRVGDPLVIEEPIVEEVHTALGRGLRAMAYSQFEEQGKVVINATLAYVWRVETEDDLSITRLWAMDDPTRILKAADDIHNLAVTLRLREDA
jgi:hypothetical protein